MISLASCGDLVFHGTLFGILFYASHKNKSYVVYRKSFQESINRHQILHAELYRLIENEVDVCEEGYTMLDEAKERLLQNANDSHIDFTLLWYGFSQLKSMVEKVTKESEDFGRDIIRCCDIVDSGVKEYEISKNTGRWVYRVMSSLLTGLTGSHLQVPRFLFKPFTPLKFITVIGGSVLIGCGFVSLFSKCLSLEEKSMNIANRRIVSNVHEIYREHSNFMFPVKNMMTKDIDHYEFLILKLIKYCDIQGNEGRVELLRAQAIRKIDSIQQQFNTIVHHVAPEKLSRIRIMQYEENPLDLLTNTVLD